MEDNTHSSREADHNIPVYNYIPGAEHNSQTIMAVDMTQNLVEAQSDLHYDFQEYPSIVDNPVVASEQYTVRTFAKMGHP
jgi:hypothetical protein